jgi:hypothetical protein
MPIPIPTETPADADVASAAVPSISAPATTICIGFMINLHCSDTPTQMENAPVR